MVVFSSISEENRLGCPFYADNDVMILLPKPTTVFAVYVCVRRFFHFFVTAKSYGITFIDVPIEMMCNKRVAELGNFKLHWSRRDGIHLVRLIHTHTHIEAIELEWATHRRIYTHRERTVSHAHTIKFLINNNDIYGDSNTERAVRCSSSLFSNVSMRDYVVHMTLIRIDEAIQLNISLTHTLAEARTLFAGCLPVYVCVSVFELNTIPSYTKCTPSSFSTWLKGWCKKRQNRVHWSFGCDDTPSKSNIHMVLLTIWLIFYWFNSLFQLVFCCFICRSIRFECSIRLTELTLCFHFNRQLLRNIFTSLVIPIVVRRWFGGSKFGSPFSCTNLF